MNRLFHVTKWPLAVLSLLFLSACSSNPADHDDDHDEHAEAHGVQLVHGGAVLYQVLEGQVSCDAAPCGVQLAVGQQLNDIEVAFFDEDGDELHGEDLGSEFTMTFTLANGSIAAVVAADRFGLNMTGSTVGTTAMQVVLNHDGHADLTTPPLTDAGAIQVTVTQ